MPTAAPAACIEPRCPNPAVHRGRCQVHRRNTSQRGYGAPHQRERQSAVAAHRPTDLCPRCQKPLGPDPAALDLGHTPDRRGYQGLEHASCNRAAKGTA